MKLTHFITTELVQEDLQLLFDGLDGLGNIFKVEDYWKNAQKLAELISERTTDPHYNKIGESGKDGFLSAVGDLGEVFLEAAVQRFPTGFHIKPGTFKNAETDQKGYDATAEHANDSKLMWIQMKFYNPYEAFGEKDKSDVIHKLDSFVQSTTQDGQIYNKRHRLLVATSREMHWSVGEIGYAAQMDIYTLSDLNHIITNGQPTASAFWYEFRDSLLQTINTTVPLPEPVTPYPDQSEDAAKICEELGVDGAVAYIAPVGTGKTVVALEVIDQYVKDEDEDSDN